MLLHSSRIKNWLEGTSQAWLTMYAVAAAFTTYFCMYAFRKPFAAGEYDQFQDAAWSGLEFKTILVISQVLGYTISKYLGIKICSEALRNRRAIMILGFIGIAELALFLFAVLPPRWKFLALFMNGLPLGMIWGLVVSYLEGRRTSDILLAGLSCSFIMSSAVVKDVGRWLMESAGIRETLMPAMTGLCFVPLLLLAVWFLDHVPQPNVKDMEARTKREPMFGRQRLKFLRHFGVGLLMLLLVYFFQTAFRDFRDNYAIDVLVELGIADPGIFSRLDVPIAFCIMFTLGCLNLIRDNRKGLIGAYIVMMIGAVITGLSTWMFQAKMIENGAMWMFLIGLGSYLTYVPFNAVLFERLQASTRFVGTAVFSIYIADALGYTGSVSIQLYKDLAHQEMNRLNFLIGFSYFNSIVGFSLLLISCLYFTLWKLPRKVPDTQGVLVPAESRS